MITVELSGRTGNNMFQIAAAINLAKKNETKPFFIGDAKYLKGFKLKGIQEAQKKAENKYLEKKFSYNEEFDILKNNTHLNGYFQSEKYFLSSEEDVRKCFSFTQTILDNVKKQNNGIYKKYIYGEIATAIHVRRTDYLNYPNIYPEIKFSYYKECLSRIKNKGVILVFSDDIGWCKSSIIGENFLYVNMQPIESMYLMSKCKNIIMANSTFGWWAAWLGQCENVMYPKGWFGAEWPNKDAHPSMEDCIKDICPKRWIAV